MVSIPFRRVPALLGLIALGACGRLGFDALPCTGSRVCTHGSSPSSSFDGGLTDGATGVSTADASSNGDGGFIGDGDGDGDVIFTPLDGGDGSTVSMPGCGSTNLLTQTFDQANSQIWYPFTRGSASVSLANQRVALHLPAGKASAEASYQTENGYDLRGGEVSVALLQTGAQVTALEIKDGRGLDRFNKPIDPRHGASIAVENGVLSARILSDDAVDVTVASIDYDAPAHRYLRFREQNGVLFWETSADRVVWSTLYQDSAPLNTSVVFVSLAAHDPLGNDSEAWFDDVNTDAPAASGYCGIDGLHDDFDDDGLDPIWQPWNGAGSCTVQQIEGQVQLGFLDEFSACALKTLSLFDLRNQAVAVELVDVPDDPAFTTMVQLFVNNDIKNYLELSINNGLVQFNMFKNTNKVFSEQADYDADAMRFVRLRESDGQTFWETSADGATFDVRAQTQTLLDLSELWFNVWGVNNTNATQAHLLIIDNVN